MTLVIALSLERCAILAADQRLLRIHLDPKRQPEVCTDTSNKLVLYSNELVVGYTGIAEFGGGERMDTWIANALRDAPGPLLTDIVPHLQKRAEALFRGFAIPMKYKKHAFVFAGYGQFEHDRPYVPVVGRLSNYYKGGATKFAEASDGFDAFGLVGGPGTIQAIHAGQDIPPKHAKWLRRHTRRRAAKDNPHPGELQDIVVQAIRSVAKANELVGSNILAAIIPREAVGTKGVLLLSRNGGAGVGLDCDPNDPEPIPVFFDDISPISDKSVVCAPLIARRGSGSVQIRSITFE